MRLRFDKIALVVSAVLIIILIAKIKIEYVTLKENDQLKYILLYTPFFENKAWYRKEGQKEFMDCKVPNCYLTSNRSLLSGVEKFDALLFHPRDMPSGYKLPQTRSPHQRYIMYMYENVIHSGGFGYQYKDFDGFFNWTMTYRMSSDIYVGTWLEEIQNPMDDLPQWPKFEPVEVQEEFRRKTLEQLRNKKSVVWLVSNCNPTSERQYYVKELQKHLQIDIFGGCGKPHNFGDTREGAMEKMGKEYKFYMAFENAICKEYATPEKFWLTMTQEAFVPIVFGGANYSRIAPPGSYIEATHITPKELADQIKSITDEDIVKRLSWKQKYRVHNSKSDHHVNLCNLCRDLHSNLPPKTWDNLHEWFFEGSGCLTPGHHPWSPK